MQFIAKATCSTFYRFSHDLDLGNDGAGEGGLIFQNRRGGLAFCAINAAICFC